MRLRLGALALVVAVWGGGAAWASDAIVLASTTSTENSGLLGDLLPRFRAASGIEVRVVAQGTGQAIRLASKGDADVLLVHDRVREDKFVADGFGVARHDVMYNDFVIVGPAADPAGIAGGSDATSAFLRIAQANALFASRGDESGTHAAELRIWKAAGIEPTRASGQWYRETGSGMGATLNTAKGLGAYALTDRGTWLSFRNQGDLVIHVQGDPPLFNPYGLIQVNPKQFPHLKGDAAKAFVDWMLSPVGQAAIAAFRVNDQQLFFPMVDAKKDE